jgi:radical SAM superfamily enzyme YgiQ (UPF0313 family)
MMKAPVVLAAFNARYAHASGALRALAANWTGERPLVLVEGTLEDDPVRFAGRLLAHRPALVAFSVHLWSLRQTEHTVRVLRRVRPDLPLVAGGPEICAPDDAPPLAGLVDVVVRGEADLAFPGLCEDVIAGLHERGAVVACPPPDLADVRLPVDAFTDDDLAHRVCYVETSRGCPMHCAFCAAPLTGGGSVATSAVVRRFPADRVLAQLQALWDRGLRRFKFLDRSIHLGDYRPVLDFFLDRPEPAFVHLELTPHRLESDLAFRLAQFSPGSLQVEIGVQTLDPAVARTIGRPLTDVVAETLEFCVNETDAHVHADLIAGLPGETLESFAAGFDALLALGVHELQLGILKRLRGTRLCGLMPEAWFNPEPPYDVLFTETLPFEDLSRLKIMARCWDLVGNSGHFRDTCALLLLPAPFDRFLAFSDWLLAATGGRTHGIELNRLATLLFEHLTTARGLDPETVRAALTADFDRCGRASRPAFLQRGGHPTRPSSPPTVTPPESPTPVRQRRHGPDQLPPVPREAGAIQTPRPPDGPEEET